MRKTFSAIVCALAFAALSGGPALAGEIAGPPGTPGVAGSATGRQTGAFSNASSICAFNGLNDMNQGPLDSVVQTPHTHEGRANHCPLQLLPCARSSLQ